MVGSENHSTQLKAIHQRLKGEKAMRLLLDTEQEPGVELFQTIFSSPSKAARSEQTISPDLAHSLRDKIQAVRTDLLTNAPDRTAHPDYDPLEEENKAPSKKATNKFWRKIGDMYFQASKEQLCKEDDTLSIVNLETDGTFVLYNFDAYGGFEVEYDFVSEDDPKKIGNRYRSSGKNVEEMTTEEHVIVSHYLNTYKVYVDIKKGFSNNPLI